MPCHPCRLALWACAYLRAVFPLDPSISQPLFLSGFSWGEGGLPFQGLQWFCASLVSLLQASRPSRSSLCWGRPSPTSGRWWEARGWVPTWRGATSVGLSFLSRLAKSGLCERLLLPHPPPFWDEGPLLWPHSQEPRIQGPCLYFSFQVTVKKVSKRHRWYLENTSCDRESCWQEKILLSARGFSVFFQMLVKAQKVGKKYLFPWSLAVFCNFGCRY